MTIVYAIIMFCLLIFVHELGHFLVARACDVKVNEFALGMGPKIWKRQGKETLYSLRAIPVGGFCAMEGEDEDSEDPRAFNNKAAWKRALILVAGASMNFLLCIVLLIIIALATGTATTVIDQVSPNSPAQQAGIRSGDKISAVNQREVKAWEEIQEEIGKAKNSLSITVNREGKNMTLQSTMTKGEDGRQIIGISPKRNHNVLTAMGEGCQSTWRMTKMMGGMLKNLFTGQAKVKDLSGPVGIVYAVSDTAKYGVLYLIYLTALISLNLGIVNLLPWPALDGGRLLFLLIRKITGKAISDEVEGKIHFVGIILLFGLMIYVTWNDVFRLIIPKFG